MHYIKDVLQMPLQICMWRLSLDKSAAIFAAPHFACYNLRQPQLQTKINRHKSSSDEAPQRNGIPRLGQSAKAEGDRRKWTISIAKQIATTLATGEIG
jgi:hypothetical protein